MTFLLHVRASFEDNVVFEVSVVEQRHAKEKYEHFLINMAEVLSFVTAK